MRRCVWSRNLKNEAMARVGPQRHREIVTEKIFTLCRKITTKNLPLTTLHPYWYSVLDYLILYMTHYRVATLGSTVSVLKVDSNT